MPPTSSPTTTTATNTGLSADEIALYDRQIRLWGAQAQERIRSAHILLISLRALGTEIAKNLVLAGISSLTILDDEVVSEEDLGAQYFLREEDVGKGRTTSALPHLRDLNPNVTITPAPLTLPDLLAQAPDYYAAFDCILACDHDFMTLSTINTAARMAGKPFYAAGIHGFYGWIFADLFGHEFVVERERPNVPTRVGLETMTRTVLSVTEKAGDNAGSATTPSAANGNSAATTTSNTSHDAAGRKPTEIVKKQELYCPLLLANTSPLDPSILSSRRKLRAVPPLLPCLRALFDFQRTHTGNLPSPTDPSDLRTFTALATLKARELLLPPETLRADFLRSFLSSLGAELLPTAAFVGGRVAEDVINVLGRREQPIQNWGFFDGEGVEGRVYCLYTPPPELRMAMEGLGMEDLGMGDGMGGMGMGMEFGMEGGMGVGFMGQEGMGMEGMGGGAGMMVDGGNGGGGGMVGDGSMLADVDVGMGVGAGMDAASAEPGVPIPEAMTSAAAPPVPAETGVAEAGAKVSANGDEGAKDAAALG